MTFVLPYIELARTGKLAEKLESLTEILRECRLCPRECGVNRLEGQLGYCQAGADLMVSSAFPHFGEEPPLVGQHGSGTIFLTHCNLRCIFCQNYDISHLGRGEPIAPSDMARTMVRLQEMGCHNINFVTPTHYAAQIVAALPLGIEMGLRLPIVYNCSGYESLEILQLLDGIVDIYMPDAKFMEAQDARQFCNAPDYPEVLRVVLKEMHRQVGDLVMDEDGIAMRGLLVRHLVLPEGAAGTAEVVCFLSQEISKNTYLNVMAQYHPDYQACRYPELSRPISVREYGQALALAKEAGLARGLAML